MSDAITVVFNAVLVIGVYARRPLESARTAVLGRVLPGAASRPPGTALLILQPAILFGELSPLS